MYIFNSRIRYSESDSEGKLTLAALINYFQDCSTFHSEDLGLGMEYLKDLHMVWVLSSWQIVVERYPALGEEVEVGTFPYDFKGFLGCRNFFLRTREGEYVAKANSLWTLLRTDNMKPVNATEEMRRGYGLEPQLEMEYMPRKITVPAGGATEEPIVVGKHHLDTNHHVNNGQYIGMAMKFLPEQLAIRQMRAEYKKQAWLGDVLYPYAAGQDGKSLPMASDVSKYVVSLRDAQNVPYVNMEFLMG